MESESSEAGTGIKPNGKKKKKCRGKKRRGNVYKEPTMRETRILRGEDLQPKAVGHNKERRQEKKNPTGEKKETQKRSDTKRMTKENDARRSTCPLTHDRPSSKPLDVARKAVCGPIRRGERTRENRSYKGTGNLPS